MFLHTCAAIDCVTEPTAFECAAAGYTKAAKRPTKPWVPYSSVSKALRQYRQARLLFAARATSLRALELSHAKTTEELLNVTDDPALRASLARKVEKLGVLVEDAQAAVSLSRTHLVRTKSRALEVLERTKELIPTDLKSINEKWPSISSLRARSAARRDSRRLEAEALSLPNPTLALGPDALRDTYKHAAPAVPPSSTPVENGVASSSAPLVKDMASASQRRKALMPGSGSYPRSVTGEARTTRGMTPTSLERLSSTPEKYAPAPHVAAAATRLLSPGKVTSVTRARQNKLANSKALAKLPKELRSAVRKYTAKRKQETRAIEKKIDPVMQGLLAKYRADRALAYSKVESLLKPREREALAKYNAKRAVMRSVEESALPPKELRALQKRRLESLVQAALNAAKLSEKQRMRLALKRIRTSVQKALDVMPKRNQSPRAQAGPRFSSQTLSAGEDAGSIARATLDADMDFWLEADTGIGSEAELQLVADVDAALAAELRLDSELPSEADASVNVGATISAMSEAEADAAVAADVTVESEALHSADIADVIEAAAELRGELESDEHAGLMLAVDGAAPAVAADASRLFTAIAEAESFFELEDTGDACASGQEVVA